MKKPMSIKKKLETAKVELRSKNEELNTVNNLIKEKMDSTHHQQDITQVSFCNSGSGIDAEAADVLFQPLSSTKKYGHCVDLPISRSLIKAYNDHCGRNSLRTVAFSTLPWVLRHDCNSFCC